MRISLYPLAALALAFLPAGLEPRTSAQGPPHLSPAEVEQVLKQLNDLQEGMEAARWHVGPKPDLAKRAEEESYYVKVEVKGRLGLAVLPNRPPSIITAQGVCWGLDFARTRHLLGQARPLAGQAVLVTGTLRVPPPAQRGPLHPPDFAGPEGQPVLTVDTLRPPGK